MCQQLNIRTVDFLNNLKFNDEGILTLTADEQIAVEQSVLRKFNHLYASFKPNQSENTPELIRKKHVSFLMDSLSRLSRGYEALDASRTWICYWVLHSLSILEVNLSDSMKSAVAKFLSKCQNIDGGFGGGPGQASHLAPTYAAVNALIILATEESYNVINRPKLLEFLWKVKQPNGSFAMHEDGEVDIRGVYCALSVASLTDILSDQLCEGVAEWIISCQTYEGGFSGAPGMEAHGGYAFCGLSSLMILGKHHLCDIPALLRWLVNRQMKLEGGFQGRTNKLVDGCYSFWQGGALALIHGILEHPPQTFLFDNRSLQEYILICCQYAIGGLIDKPGKNRDEYHTCYVLSGLSIAQHFNSEFSIVGSPANEVACTHPLYNIRTDLLRKALLYYKDKKEEDMCSSIM